MERPRALRGVPALTLPPPPPLLLRPSLLLAPSGRPGQPNQAQRRFPTAEPGGSEPHGGTGRHQPTQTRVPEGGTHSEADSARLRVSSPRTEAGPRARTLVRSFTERPRLAAATRAPSLRGLVAPFACCGARVVPRVAAGGLLSQVPELGYWRSDITLFNGLSPLNTLHSSPSLQEYGALTHAGPSHTAAALC